MEIKVKKRCKRQADKQIHRHADREKRYTKEND